MEHKDKMREDVARSDAAAAARADQAQARREQEARERLLALGADRLDDRPWRPAPVPPSAVDLVQYALWRSADLAPEDVAAALSLLPAARAEVDGLEDGLLFVARGAGLTWAQIARATGFNSPQACQQHHARLATRRASAS
ncbi:DNA-binding protein [Cellulomonas wangsupingiae]|uniref:DNA-binding protein n=1 Tax=Cellulomonas wangsupingiae TaxID=2968085 RepID=UPI001D0DE6D7|nr:DNA-binding protein [Cellulomonas wangsupingiae]MCM0638821.1 DNA-binding protein [Cellulomonas wangsupingiae]